MYDIFNICFPSAVGDTVLDCLEQLGLTEFLTLLNESDFTSQNILGQMPFTLFAPTNAAIEAVRDDINFLDPTMLVGNHIVGQALKQEELGFDRRFLTLSNLTIHSTTVVFGDLSLYRYSPNYRSSTLQPNIRYSVVSL